MKKYNKQEIYDYIKGYELLNIEELENNKEFMMEVLNITNDKNIYNLCSDNIKNNFKFVKYLIIKYQYDIDFIKNVGDYFLENNNDEVNKTEIIILLYLLTKDNKYNLLFAVIYGNQKYLIEEYKKNNELYTGKGFNLIIRNFNKSEITINYFFIRFLYEIINNELFENEVIDLYRNNNLSKESIVVLLGKYDKSMAYYITSNIYLLEELKKGVLDIIDRDNSQSEDISYINIFNKVKKYMNNNKDNTVFKSDDFIYLFAKTFGLTDILKKYDIRSNEEIDNIINNIDVDYYEKILKHNRKEMIHYNKVKQIIIDELFKYDESFKRIRVI